MAVTSEPTPLARLAYSPAEVATMLGCSRQHIQNLLRDGVIRSTTLGRKRLIPADVLAELLAGIGEVVDADGLEDD